MSNASITVEGYLSADPRTGTTQSGDRYLSFSVPHTPRRFDKDSQQWVDAGDTLWVQVTLWRDDADRFEPHLRKGVQVHVQGEPVLKMWESQSKSGANLDVKFARVAIIPARSDRPQEPVSGTDDVWVTPGASDDETPF